MGKTGARSSGPTGLPRPDGGAASWESASSPGCLYHCFGILVVVQYYLDLFPYHVLLWYFIESFANPALVIISYQSRHTLVLYFEVRQQPLYPFDTMKLEIILVQHPRYGRRYTLSFFCRTGMPG